MRRLAPGILVLATCLSCAQAASQGSAPATADDKADAQTRPEVSANEPAGASSVTADEEQGEQASTTEGASPSPFDYNPSEEISEDLSVSFPVDI